MDDVTDADPMGIDGPGYTDRDREMFALGCEFCSVSDDVKAFKDSADGPFDGYFDAYGATVREANVDRLVALSESLDLLTKVHHMADGWATYRVERRPS